MGYWFLFVNETRSYKNDLYSGPIKMTNILVLIIIFS